jgi:hypothetical protein
VGPTGCSLEIFYQGTRVAIIYAKQSISLNGLSNEVTGVSGRGSAKKSKDPISIAWENPEAITPADRAQVMIAKQLLDWAQIYFIGFLWHNFGIMFTLITNDTFLLRTAKWFKIPFVMLMSKNGAKLYCFDTRAMVLEEDEKVKIGAHVIGFTAAKNAELVAAIDRYIISIFKNDHNGTAIPIIGCLFSKVLVIKQKILATIEAIVAAQEQLAANRDTVAQQFRYLLKQEADVYLLTKFKDDIETLFSSAKSVTRSINSFINKYAKKEDEISLSATLSSIVDAMKTFMPTINDEQTALWLTKLPFPISLTRAELQKDLFAALIGRSMGVTEVEIKPILQAAIKLHTPFTADDIRGRAPAAAAAAAAAEIASALAIANNFRKFAAVDWGLVKNGEPSYPYYYLLGGADNFVPTTPPDRSLSPIRYDNLSSHQQERVQALGYDEAGFNALEKPIVIPPSDTVQKILQYLSDFITTIGVAATATAEGAAFAGGRRRNHKIHSKVQRGGARNDAFRSLTMWDKNSLDYMSLLNRIYENDIAERIEDAKRAPAAAAAAAAPVANPESFFLASTLEERIGLPPIADYFYKLEAYLWYCLDFVEESRSDILIADYITMLTVLSDLRLKCFEGTLTESDLLVEVACILLNEDDDFPSVFSVLHNNGAFDKNFIYIPLRDLLDTIADVDDLKSIYDEIFPRAGRSAGAAAAAPPPPPVDIFHGSNDVLLTVYSIHRSDATLLDIVRHTSAMKTAAALAVIAQEEPAEAAGGAGGGGGDPIHPLQKEMEALEAELYAKEQTLHDMKGPPKREALQTPPPKGTPKTPAQLKIESLEQETSSLRQKVDEMRTQIETAAVAKGAAKGPPPRRGGFRHTRSRIGKKRTTRKAAASSTGRKTRRRK